MTDTPAATKKQQTKLLDLIAMRAMQSLILRANFDSELNEFEIAERSYKFAQAMLTQHNKER